MLTEDWAGLETKKEKEMFCVWPSMRPSMRPWDWWVVMFSLTWDLVSTRLAAQDPSLVWLPNSLTPPGALSSSPSLTLCWPPSVSLLSPSQLRW